MEETPGTTQTDPPAGTSPQDQPAGAAPARETAGFRSRGAVRRRVRFLRKARELGYRDLGGLVFSLHRFGQRNDALVLAKLTTLGQIDTELRALESSLREREAVTILREAGVTACPRCAAIHSSEDNFCPNCGLSTGRHADLPIAAPASTSTPPPPPAQPPAQPLAQPPVAAPSPAPAAPAPTVAPVAATTTPDAPQPSDVQRPTSARPAAPASRPEEEDGPTEILGPPVSGP